VVLEASRLVQPVLGLVPLTVKHVKPVFLEELLTLALLVNISLDQLALV